MHWFYCLLTFFFTFCSRRLCFHRPRTQIPGPDVEYPCDEDETTGVAIRVPESGGDDPCLVAPDPLKGCCLYVTGVETSNLRILVPWASTRG